MDFGYNIELFSGDAHDGSENSRTSEVTLADPGFAYPRPVTSATVAGHLLCHARLGSISSVMTIDAEMCGSEGGCDGRWYCLTGKAPEPAITSGSGSPYDFWSNAEVKVRLSSNAVAFSGLKAPSFPTVI